MTTSETSNKQKRADLLVGFSVLFFNHVENLFDDWIKDLSAEEEAWDREFTVDESNFRVVRV